MNHSNCNWHLKKWLSAAAFLGIANASAQGVTPPPKPPDATSIQPGEPEAEKKANKHGHHHPGHVKKDKNKEKTNNGADAPKGK